MREQTVEEQGDWGSIVEWDEAEQRRLAATLTHAAIAGLRDQRDELRVALAVALQGYQRMWAIAHQSGLAFAAQVEVVEEQRDRIEALDALLEEQRELRQRREAEVDRLKGQLLQALGRSGR